MKYDVLTFDYSRYADLFEDMLSDEVFLNPNETMSNITEEDKRVSIFRQALQEEKGLQWVNEILNRENLRSLYVRNPVEFALKHCLLCNDTENAYQKYNHKTFVALWKDIKTNLAFSGVKLHTEKNGSQKMITFGTLRDFVFNSSKESELQHNLRTEEITEVVKNELEQIDVTQADAYSVFKSTFAKCCEQLCETSQSIRYYFAKYIYYIICHQVMELKEILLKFTSSSPKNFLESSKEENGGFYKWSLLKGIFDDKTLENIIAGVDSNKQISKELLRASLNNFVLKGMSTTTAHIGLLEQEEQLSVLKNKTQIFGDGLDKDKHENFVTIIRDIELSDFYGYAINFNKLFHLLFELILSKEETWKEEKEYKQDYRKKYIVGILNGEYDMSRSAVLLFLASAKGALYDVEKLKSSDDVLFDDQETLKLRRVNYMLNRMGYVNVGDDFSYEQSNKVDDIYYEIFTAPHTDTIALDSLSDVVGDFVNDFGFSPIPFEISEITAKERRKNIIKENL